MDEMQMIGTLLAKPEPARDTFDEGRHRLQRTMRGGRPVRRRGRTGRLAAGLALTATAGAAATAAVVATGQDTPPATSKNGPPIALNGRQVLLAAASTAARTPAGSGTYWHVKLVRTGGRSAQFEYWTRRDGRSWVRGLKTRGNVVPLARTKGRKPFSLVGAELTYHQLRALPADPTKLKAWIADAVRHGGATTSAGRLSASDRDEAVFESLVSLVSTLPAPPKVRAAAFRAIATSPGVTSTGAVDGGQGVLIPSAGGHRTRLVVDPKTSRVHDTNYLVTPDGAVEVIASPGTVTVSADWTDTPPE